MYSDQVINEPHVVLPSPDIVQYPFVIKPLYDIAPNLIHPVLNKSMQQLWQQFDKTKVKLEQVELSDD